MQILVTGGAGFIGGHLVAGLLNQGHRVRVLDNLSTGRRERVEALCGSVELIVGDICDQTTLDRAVAGCDAVFHLAALVSVEQSLAEPLVAQAINATGSMMVMETSRQAGVRRVVQASTCAVYGGSDRLPLGEDTPPDPLSPYAVTKLSAEYAGRLYTSLYGLEVVALRFFNVYGAGQDPASPYAAVVPRFLTRMAAGHPITIYGDGLQSRDFVYVGDVVGALMAASTAPGAAGTVLNVGSGVGTTVLDLAHAIAGQLGVSPQITFEPGRSGEVRHSLADTRGLTELVGYTASMSLSQGIALTASAAAEPAVAR